MPWNYKALFDTAFDLLKEQIRQHENGCGCQDVEDGIGKGGKVEGPCPGLKKSKKFIEHVERKVRDHE